ncbi:hypothetical protein AB0F77_28340 [Streptomyces sp. NPDC026672]|uniref:hypothetical protein n=1 Tax=unclassified Streptomyces TaxID=2593676 RepID=UPI0033EDB132
MRSLTRALSATVTTTIAAVAAVGLAAPSASAANYSSDECSASGNNRCFTLFYNSQAGAIFASSCFVANRDLPDLAGGPSGNGTTYYNYVFDARDLITNDLGYCDNGSGSGQPVKNNAAAGSNTLGSTVRVYYNSGYGGPYQSFAPGEIKNLNSQLKNENASLNIV